MMMKIRSHNSSTLFVLLALGAYHRLPGMDPLRLFEIKQPGIAPGLVNPADYAAWCAKNIVCVEAETTLSVSELSDSSTESYTQESTSDTQPFSCDLCDKCYSSLASLRSHRYKEHVIEPQFACDFCNRKFKFYSRLREHNHFVTDAQERVRRGVSCRKARTRGGQKAFQCIFPDKQEPCGISFTLRPNCVSHIIRQHLRNKSRLEANEFVLDLK